MADEPEAPEPEPAPEAPTEAPKSDDLTGLKSALETERAQRKEFEKELKALRTAEEQRKQEAMTETEKAIAAAKAEGHTEAMKAAGQRLAAAELKSAAKDKGLNLAKVQEFLKVDAFVDENGDVNSEAIEKAVAAFAEVMPAQGAPRSGGDFGGGPNLAPASLDAQIAAAQKAGNVREVIRLQNLKLATVEQ